MHLARETERKLMFAPKILFHILMFSVSVGRTPQLQSKFYVTIDIPVFIVVILEDTGKCEEPSLNCAVSQQLFLFLLVSSGTKLRRPITPNVDYNKRYPLCCTANQL
jgi:hypothetical protein